MTTPMSAERFADRFRFYRNQPQQQRGVLQLCAAISSSDKGAEILDEQAPWALTFSQKPAAPSAPAVRAAQRKPGWPARSWQLPSSLGIPTCW